MILIAVIGISIIIASIDRFFPLHTALKMQKAKRHETFMKRQRLFSETKEVTDDEKQKVVEGLKKQRYKVRNENGHILAEKGRFSRWEIGRASCRERVYMKEEAGVVRAKTDDSDI